MSRKARRRAAAGAPDARQPAVAAPVSGQPATVRLPLVDEARAVAIALMVVYHFCFDLNWFRYVQFDFVDGVGWILFRTLIITIFLFLVGFSIPLAEARAPGWKAFWRRLAMVGGGALLVTAGSWLTFPQSFIYFGILHHIAVTSLLARLLMPLRGWNVAIGLAVIIAGLTLSLPILDSPPLHFIGMLPVKPRTEDYVPLFPWAGIALIGLAAGSWWVRHGESAAETAPVSRLRRTMRFAGRHSLAIYLLHQPIMIGLLWVFTALFAGR